MTCGKRIRAARKHAGMTQKELAAKLGIPYQSIGQWERDIRNPKPATIFRIALALNVDAGELMGWPAGTVKPMTEDAKQFAEDVIKFAEKDLNHVFNEIIEEVINDEKTLLGFLSCLNDTGKEEAIKRVQELTEIPKYQRKE